MFNDKEKSYFGGLGSAKPEAKKPAVEAGDGDEKPVATVTVHAKPEGGHMFRHDAHDGMPPEEHDSVAELAKELEEKYGEDKTEEAEEHVSPGVHRKAGDYLNKIVGGE